jgi:hypothetical protein
VEADIAELLDAIPTSLRDLSGTALYSGLNAWTGQRPVYLLGFNPGGKPGDDTVYGNAVNLLHNLKPDYSSYVDESWEVRGHHYSEGEAPMQLRVRYFLDRLGLLPGEVPTSNIIYARSPKVSDLPKEQALAWAQECWPFHARMIYRFGVRVVVCYGGDAAGFVRAKLGAHTLVETYREQSCRKWSSHVHTGPGPAVIQLAHPGRSKWTSPGSDPTGLVVRALAASAGAIA